ncbi:MAG: VWA domain-containing protein [bacterium]|nr:VWA domain-containing protein [bacterium]
MEFRFAYPLLLLALLIPFVIYYQPRLRRFRPRTTAALRYSDVRLMRGLPAGWRTRLRWLPDGLRWGAWMLLVIALARPQSGQAQEIVRGSGLDIVLVLDISNSMAALDFAPQNRLETAKAVIGDFITGRQFDRIGLVVFARNSYHQAPLTLDYDVLRQLLNEVQLVADVQTTDGSTALLDGTAVGLGIASAANMLRESSTPSKLIILLTDGDNNAGLDPLEAATAAAVLNMRVYTVGIGRTGLVEIPDENGNLVTFESQLDETALQAIAEAGNGRYFRAEDRASLEAVYAEINTLERSPVERRILVRWNDQAAWLLLPAFMLLLYERFLRRTVFQTLP